MGVTVQRQLSAYKHAPSMLHMLGGVVAASLASPTPHACAERGALLEAQLTALVAAPGVIGGGFGAVEAIKRLGLERRVFAMGKLKAALDPFKCACAQCSHFICADSRTLLKVNRKGNHVNRVAWPWR